VRQRPRFVPGLRSTVLDALLTPFLDTLLAPFLDTLLAAFFDTLLAAFFDALLPPFVEAAPAALFKGLLPRAVDVGAGHVGELRQSGFKKLSQLFIERHRYVLLLSAEAR